VISQGGNAQLSKVQATTPTRQDRLTHRLRQVEEHFQRENAHDHGAFMAMFGAQPCFALNGQRIDGHAGISALYGERLRGFRDVRFEVLHRFVAEDTVIVECLLTGTHDGCWQCDAPTGRRLEVPAYAIFRFDASGRLTGETLYFDAARLLHHLAPLSQAA
jgi:hypothetical protein